VTVPPFRKRSGRASTRLRETSPAPNGDEASAASGTSIFSPSVIQRSSGTMSGSRGPLEI